MDQLYTTLSRIRNAAEKAPGAVKLYEDWFSALRLLETPDVKESADLRTRIQRNLRQLDNPERGYGLIRKTYLYEAPLLFDSYCIALEWDREPEKRFYLPRRRVLKTLADDLQALYEREIDFLGVSLPPRVGKSTLCIFFITWIMGKHPDDASVMSGHSDKLTSGFHSEVLNILTDPEYCWKDIFPDVKLADKSARDETIDLHRKKRFCTLTCRSVLGTLTGAVEVGSNGVLYTDDLIEDLEESLNMERLDAKYSAYLNQLKDRKKMGAMELMVGTRWNVFDPLGRVADQYAGNPRYRFRVIPAVDEEGHSNFAYQYGLGFDDAYYADMKASIDDATWWAKYMGKPYIREGLLFPRDELRRYNGVLPDGDPDCKVMVADIAWGGGDYTSAPVAYRYGEAVYIHDVVFNDGDKTVTKPEMLAKLKQHLPHRFRGEANNGGDSYCESLDDQLREDGFRLNIRSQRAPNNQSKLSRIIQYAPEIKRFYFLDDAHAGREYKAFLQQLTTFVQTGKNPHDDAPDSLAMLADELYSGYSRVEAVRRPW